MAKACNCCEAWDLEAKAGSVDTVHSGSQPGLRLHRFSTLIAIKKKKIPLHTTQNGCKTSFPSLHTNSRLSKARFFCLFKRFRVKSSVQLYNGINQTLRKSKIHAPCRKEKDRLWESVSGWCYAKRLLLSSGALYLHPTSFANYSLYPAR